MNFKIDYSALLNTYKRHIAWILLATIACGALMFCYSKYMLPERYVSTAKVYVNAQVDDQGRTSVGILSSSKELIKSASTVLQGDDFLNRIGSQITPPLTASQIRGCVAYTSVNDTETMRISVTTENKELSYLLCQLISQEAPTEMRRVMSAGDYTVYDQPKLPTSKYFPNNKEYAITGAVTAFVVYVGIIFLIHFFDNSIKSASDVKEYMGLPVLGEVPSFERRSKKKRLSLVSKKKKTKKNGID